MIHRVTPRQQFKPNPATSTIENVAQVSTLQMRTALAIWRRVMPTRDLYDRIEELINEVERLRNAQRQSGGQAVPEH